jgi:hypothetical protein
MTTVEAGRWAKKGRNCERGNRSRRATLPGRSETATSKTAFARSTAMRVSFCMDGLLLLLPSTDSGTSMPTEPAEESISSMKLTRLAASPGWLSTTVWTEGPPRVRAGRVDAGTASQLIAGVEQSQW